MNEQLIWVKEVIDGETRRLEYPPVNKQNADGSWVMNYNCDTERMTADGYEQWTAAQIEEWHQQYDPPAPVYERQRCTKYQLVTCLRTHYPSLLPTLRAAYAASADLAFYWNTVQDLDKNNADFKEAQTALGISDEQVKEIFAKIDGPEPVSAA